MADGFSMVASTEPPEVSSPSLHSAASSKTHTGRAELHTDGWEEQLDSEMRVQRAILPPPPMRAYQESSSQIATDPSKQTQLI